MSAASVLTRSQKKSKKLKCDSKECIVNLNEDNEILECKSCQEIFHAGCSGLNEHVYAAIKQNEIKDNFIFCCKLCMPKVRKLITTVESLEKISLKLRRN